MNEIIQTILQSNIINFLIVLAFLIFLVYKINLSEKLEKVREEITSYIEASEKEKQNAQEELNRINDKIAKLPAVVERIKKSTERNIKNLEENSNKSAEIQKKDISRNAQRLFNLETKKFKTELSNILSEHSIRIARENAVKQLEENPNLHDKYIEDAIEEIDRITL